MKIRGRLGLLIAAFIGLIVLFLCFGLNPNSWQYALSRRIPKVIAIVFTGGAIALSTIIFQTITNNRILTPSILGLDSLYMFLQTTVVFFLGSSGMAIISSHTNFLLSVGLMMGFSALLYYWLFKRKSQNIFFLLLVGVILGSLFQSMSSFMQLLIDPNEFLVIQSKMFASFNQVNTDILKLAAVLIVACILYAYRHVHLLDVVSLGREQAINLGVPYDRIVKRMLVVVAMMVSVSTALVGPITFLGILVANLARESLKTYQHKYLVAGSMLISGVALVGGQFIIERALRFQTPISVVINLIGGTYFIYLLLKESQG